MPDKLDVSMPRWLSIKKLSQSIAYRAVPSCICAHEWIEQVKAGTMTLDQLDAKLGQYLTDFRHSQEQALELLIDTLDEQGLLEIATIRQRVTNNVPSKTC